MQRPEPETPDSPSTAGGDLGHFTDWREQLRDRVREIRARKLADKRGEDASSAPESDPAEQAAAARAEKLRAAREAIEGTRPNPDAGLESARIEQRIEEIAEEVAEAASEQPAEEDTAPRAAFDGEFDAATEVADEPDEMPQIAARTEVDPELKLGTRDRSARRSEIADVVDSLLGPPDDAGAPNNAPAMADVDLDALFQHEDDADAPEATEPLEAVEEQPVAEQIAEELAPEEEPTEELALEDAAGDEIDDHEWEAIEAADARDREPTPESADAESVEAAVDYEEDSVEEADPFASAPAWARASFVPRKPRPTHETSEEVGDNRIPPELEDVDIPSWALPREPQSRASQEATDLFEADDEAAPAQADDEPASAAEIAARALDSFDDDSANPEVDDDADTQEIELDAATERPTEAPVDADLFAPEEEAGEVELFAAEVDSSPLTGLLASDDETADEIADELDEPEMGMELDVESDLDPEPEPEPAEATTKPPTADKQRSEGDVFLLGEFRSRGRLTKYESRQAGEVDAASAEKEPGDVPSGQTLEAAEEREFEDAVTTAPIDLFDEAEPEAETDAADIEWDLDKPGDPDTILDAQRGDADPSAPVADRIFAVMADALVLLTIAVLLAIAGARAADVPIMPFVGAAPLPFVLAVLLFGFAYGVFFTGTCGQTLGKMAMRVRVIGSDSFRVGYTRAAQRALYYAVAALPVGLGLLPALRDPEHRALHDRMSNTRVVKA